MLNRFSGSHRATPQIIGRFCLLISSEGRRCCVRLNSYHTHLEGFISPCCFIGIFILESRVNPGILMTTSIQSWSIEAFHQDFLFILKQRLQNCSKTFEDIFPRYHMQCDVFSRIKSPTTQSPFLLILDQFDNLVKNTIVY